MQTSNLEMISSPENTKRENYETTSSLPLSHPLSHSVQATGLGAIEETKNKPSGLKAEETLLRPSKSKTKYVPRP